MTGRLKSLLKLCVIDYTDPLTKIVIVTYITTRKPLTICFVSPSVAFFMCQTRGKITSGFKCPYIVSVNNVTFVNGWRVSRTYTE